VESRGEESDLPRGSGRGQVSSRGRRRRHRRGIEKRRGSLAAAAPYSPWGEEQWWTSSRTEVRFSSPGLQEPVWPEAASLPPPDPHGVVLSCEVHDRSRRRISGSRPPPRRFDDLAVFRKQSSRHRSTDASRGLGSPPGHTGQSPPESPDSSSPPEVSCPCGDVGAEVHKPGFPHPVRSAFRVSHPLDGFLPPAPSGLEDRSHPWGSPCRAFPPRGAVRLSAPLPSGCF